MQKCKYCGFEFDGGLACCPECATKVTPAELPKEEPAPDSEQPSLCKLTTVAGPMESEVLISFLRSCGIDAYASSSGLAAYLKIRLGTHRIGEDIMVSEKDYEQAAALLQDFAKESEPEPEPASKVLLRFLIPLVFILGMLFLALLASGLLTK